MMAKKKQSEKYPSIKPKTIKEYFYYSKKKYYAMNYHLNSNKRKA